LLGETYAAKFNGMKENKEVAASQGQKFHCPRIDCKGVIDK
jgi:hypothetical protein